MVVIVQPRRGMGQDTDSLNELSTTLETSGGVITLLGLGILGFALFASRKKR
jgi:LPXTG-motif cell wall-anchored protein